MKIANNIRIYDSGLKKGWGVAVWREMFAELIDSRELIWRLFIRNFKAKYSQTILGFLWVLIMPIMAIATFIFLNRAGVLNIGEIDIPYPAYALLGLTIWQIFAGGLRDCSKSIVEGGSMVVKINFPKESLVISSFGQALLEFLIRLLMTTIVFIAYKIIPAWTIIFFPLAIIPLFLLTLGLGLLFSLLNAVFHDIANIVTLSSTFLLFITPVLYPEPKIGFFKYFCVFNPLSALISGPRDLILKGYLTQPLLYAIYSGVSLGFFLIAWRLFHLAEIRIAERIGAR